ncbi:LysE family translocator [Vibrio ouci]|nr:LysE family translocator [Vibrio ouci]
MNGEFYLSVFLFAFSASITPGPNTMMIMSSGVNYGLRQSLPHLAGITLGFPLLTLCIGLGMGTMIFLYPNLMLILKVVSVLYLFHLALKVATSASVKEAHRRRPLSLIEAALFQWVNPKAWFVSIGAVSAFTSGSERVVMEVITLAGIFWLCALLSSLFWLVSGATFKRRLEQNGLRQAFNVVIGALLALSVLPTVVEVFGELNVRLFTALPSA